ncbi:hypothetical protein SLA2020_442020 [Shorea laevis]
MRTDRERSRGCRGGGGDGSSKDKIDALGRLLMRILRHMATESHTVDDIREAVRKDNKQRFGLLEENGKLLIRANQGHTIMTVESESLLKPILSTEEFPVCVHGTYRKIWNQFWSLV